MEALFYIEPSGNNVPVNNIATSPFTFTTNVDGTYSLFSVSDADCDGNVFGEATIEVNDLLVLSAASTECLPDQTQYTVSFTATTGVAPYLVTGTGAPGSWIADVWTSDPIDIDTDYDIDVNDDDNCNVLNVSGNAAICNCDATATMSGSTDICANQMATITVDLVGVAPWSIVYIEPSGNNVPVNNIATSPFTFTTNVDGTYSLFSVSDADCDGNVFGEATIEVNDLLVLSAASTECLPDQTQYTVSFTATTGVAPYLVTGTGAPGSWIADVWTSDPIDIDTDYDIDVNDDDNCNVLNVSGNAAVCNCDATATMSGSTDICANQMATITVDLIGVAPWSIVYIEPSGNNVPVNNIATSPFTFTTNVDGTYSLFSVSDADCDGNVFGEATIEVNDLLVLSAASTECLPDQTQYTVSFTATTGVAPYLVTGTGAPGSWIADVWTSDPIDIDTDYDIDVNDDDNCNVLNVSGNAAICNCDATATISGSTDICANQIATITVDLIGVAPWSIVYIEPSGNNVPVNNIATSPFTFTTNVDGTYSLFSVSDADCDGNVFGEATIEVNDLLVLSAASTECLPDQTQYTVSFTATTGVAPYIVTGTGAPGSWIADVWTSDPIDIDTDYDIDVNDDDNCNVLNVSGNAAICNCDATATMSGSADICANQMATITVDLVGVAPWSIVYIEPSGNNVPVNNIATSPFTFTTNVDGTYSLFSVSDADCDGNVFGEATIEVNDLLVLSAASTECLPDQTQYTVSFTATTGVAPYLVTGTGAPGSWIADVWTSDPIDIDTDYVIDVNDDDNCNVLNVSGNAAVCNCDATATISGSTDICANQMATITVDLIGVAPWSIVYIEPSGNNVPVNNIATSPFIFTTNVDGTYSLFSVSDADCDGNVFGEATIEVNDLLILSAASTECLPDQTQYTVSFTATTGVAPYLVTGTGAPGSWIADVWTSDPIDIDTDYDIDVNDDDNCNVLNVSGNAAICNCDATATMSGSTDICANQMATITVDLIGVAPWSIVYIEPSGNNVPVNNIATSPFTFTTNVDGTYSLFSVSDADCDGNVFGEAIIEVNDLLVLSAASTECLPDQTQYTVSFTATTGVAPYLVTGTGAPGSWIADVWTSDPIDIDTDYDIDVNDDDNCNVLNVSGNAAICNCDATATISGSTDICANQIATITVDLIGVAPWSIVYIEPSGNNVPVNNIATSPFTFTTNVDGTYSLFSVSDADCDGNVFGEATIEVNDLLVLSAASTECLPDQTQYTVSFTATTGVAPYLVTGTGAPGSWIADVWTSDPIDIDTDYDIDVNDDNNCNVLNVSGNAAICNCDAAATMSGSTDICANQMATITVDLVGVAPWSIVYIEPSGNNVPVNNIATSPFTFTTNVDGTYSLFSVSDADCDGNLFGEATIEVNDLLVLSAASTECLPDQTQYTVSFTATTGVAPYLVTGTGAPGSWIADVWTSDPIDIDTDYDIDVNDDDNCNVLNVSGNAAICNCDATATMSGSTDICANQMATITVDLIGVAPWSIVYIEPSGNNVPVNNIATSPFTFTTNVDGTYSLFSVSDADCDGNVFGEATIEVNDLLVLSAASTECLPDQTQYTVSFTATTGVAPYLVTGTGAPGSWIADVWTSDPIDIDTDYVIDVNDDDNCNVLNVSGNAAICNCDATATISGSTDICANQIATITVDLIGVAPWSIVYIEPSGNNVPVNNIATSPFIFTTNVDGTYSLFSVSDADCDGNVFGEATIEVNDLLILSAASTECLPDQTQYTVSFTATTGVAPYIVTGTGAPGSWIADVWTSDPIDIDTDYDIDVNDDDNCNVLNVSGNAPNCSCTNPATTDAGPDQIICSNEIVNLNGVFGGGATMINWSTSGTGTFGVSDTPITTYTPSPADIATGTVTLIITTDDPDGTGILCNAEVSEMELTINTLTPPTFLNPGPLCETDNIISLQSISQEGITGTWVPANIDPSGAMDVSATFTSNSGQCASDINMTIEVTPAINPTFNIADTYCTDSTTPTLPSTSNNGIDGIWTPAVIDNNNSDSYTFTPDSSLCANPFTLDIEITDTIIFTLNDIICSTDVVLVNGIVYGFGNPSGTETIMNGSVSGCDSTIVVNLAFYPQVSGSISAESFICPGDSTAITLNLNGSSASAIYYATFSDGVSQTNLSNVNDGDIIMVAPSATTTYTLSAVSELSIPCDPISATSSITIGVSEISVTTLIQSDFDGFGVSCNSNADGIAVATAENGLAPYSYEWDNGSTTEVAANLEAGVYHVTATDTLGCTATDQVVLFEPTGIQSLAIAITPTCYGDNDGSIILDTIFGGSGPYEVSFDGLFFSEINSFPFTIPFQESGQHDISIQDMNDCMEIVSVTVPEPSQYSLGLADKVELLLGDSLSIAINENFLIDTFYWSPLDWMSCVGCLEPVVQPQSTITYSIEAMDSLGCTVYDEILVEVLKPRPVYIPNAFSPNNDGINDVFMIYSDQEVQNVKYLRVFDRWGELVFEQENFKTNDIRVGWDGYLNGKPVQVGVFVYVAEVEYLDGFVELFKGDLTILR